MAETAPAIAPEAHPEIVRTSQPRWLDALARNYKDRSPVVLVDDAGIGLDPSSQTLLLMAKQAGLSQREVAGACVAAGMSAVGITMIVLAFLDPEPTSKLGLLVAGGTVCTIYGGFSALRIFTKHTPPNVRVSPRGIEISWNNGG
ncbi:MAG TPA: hypothetical protein VF730_13520 [Terracidiphilus sp.]